MLDIELPEEEETETVLERGRQGIAFDYIGAVPLIEYDACRQGIAEMKQRFLRKGVCPHDTKPCKHANNCALLKAETCFNFKALRKRSNSNMLCEFCLKLPVGVKCADCPNFRCMVAYKGR